MFSSSGGNGTDPDTARQFQDFFNQHKQLQSEGGYRSEDDESEEVVDDRELKAQKKQNDGGRLAGATAAPGASKRAKTIRMLIRISF